MITVLIGAFAAVGTGIQTAVAGTVVVFPGAITVAAVAGTGTHQFITIPSVIIPAAA